MVLVLGRRLPEDKNQSGESDGSLFVPRFMKTAVSLCEFLCVGLKCEFVSALRRGVGADGVEQHAADGGQRPEETLREKRADRSQNERAAPP